MNTKYLPHHFYITEDINHRKYMIGLMSNKASIANVLNVIIDPFIIQMTDFYIPIINIYFGS